MRPFELLEPQSISEAVGLLDPEDPFCRVIAGGTALMLMMKTGVLQPERLISLRGIEKRYSQLAFEKDGALRAGAMTPLRALECSREVKERFPVLIDTLRVLSNVRTRNVATLGGNLAHADPHMDLPPVLIALNGQITALGPSGERSLAVEDLFAGYYETTLAPDEVIAEVVVPAQPEWRSAYLKCTTRSADDWPALGTAVSLKLNKGVVEDCRIVVSAATEKPVRLAAAEAALRGSAVDDEGCRAACEAAAGEAELIGDMRGSEDYKRQLLRVYVGRALRKAAAGEGTRR